MKKVLFFLLATTVSLVAAGYRWGDSAHSIGVIKAGGGEARHAATMDAGKDGYTLISTATVLPPYSGNVRVALEGTPHINYSVHMSAPAIDLGIRRLPRLSGNTIYRLRPGDRPAIWVVMHPPTVDPVCGMAAGEGVFTEEYEGKTYTFCSADCMYAFSSDPERYKDNDGVSGRYTLSFYDNWTNESVLTVPVIFRKEGEVGYDGGHNH